MTGLDPTHWSIITFAAYLILVFVIAFFSHRLLKGRSFLKEYFLGSRGLGLWAMAMTYAATSASGGSFTGFPSLIYRHGWVLAPWIASYMLVPVMCLGLMGKRINHVARKTGAITLPDILRDRFRCPGLGILISLLLAFFLAVYLVAQFKAGGVIVQVLLNDQIFFDRLAEPLAWVPRTFSFLGDPASRPTAQYCLGVLIFAAGVIIYTAYGGFRAVVWTDVLQGVVMFFGVMILLPLALSKAGGLETATRDLASRPMDRIGEVELTLLASPGSASFEIPEGTVIRILKEGKPFTFTFTKARALGGAKGKLHARVIVRAVDPVAIPADGWSGGGDRARWADAALARRVRIDRFEVGTRRSLVAGPGPHSRHLDGFLPIGLALSFFVMWPITGAGQPGTLVRLMAFKNTRVYRRSIFTVSIYFSLIYLSLVLIFICSRSILPALDQPDEVMARMVKAVAPPLLTGILLAAPFAAIMSTVDSFLLMISSSLVRDVYQRSIHPGASERTIRRGSYLATLAAGIIVTLGALNPPLFLQDIVVFASTGLACCFLAPMVLALYWKRATATGMVAAILGGLATTLVLYAINWVIERSIGPYNLFGILPAVWGLIASFAAGIIGSLMTSKPPEELVQFYFSAPMPKKLTAAHRSAVNR